VAYLQESYEGVERGVAEAEDGLEAGAAPGEPLLGVALGEEDRGPDAVARWLEPEAHGHEELAPTRGHANLVLDALLRRVHGVLLPAVYPLQGLLHEVEGDAQGVATLLRAAAQ
jgi:hypothetical protein